MAHQAPRLLWSPPDDAAHTTEMADFAARLHAFEGFDWHGDYHRLWQYSVDHLEAFWAHLWDWHGIIGDKGGVTLAHPGAMIGGQFFPEGRLNYAENMLADADDTLAIIAHGEGLPRREMTRREVARQVKTLAGWMRGQGVVAGDRVAAYTPNIPEAVITMLAAASIGAIFSSCSCDFGLTGVKDRLGQIAPKVLMAADGYRYNGKRIERLPLIKALLAELPSVEATLICPVLDPSPDLEGLEGATLFADALEAAEPIEAYAALPFNHPLYILYSSGTTGAPKCIIHGAGGALLQHIKEHRLQCDSRPGDKVFYFTTCGWMMWNWLVSAMACRATVVLYEGSPFYPGPETLWHMAGREGVQLFGTSAKYLDAVRKSGYRPIDDMQGDAMRGDDMNLGGLRQICSTGSPLTSDGFDFVYDAIKPDVHLASISGGTDLVSCFVLGCPHLPVYAGEIQARGLGMAVDIWDESGQSIRGEQGELVCTRPFPSMPVGFWDDADGSRYRTAYFDHFPDSPDVWRHGDWATLTQNGGIIIHGRSDATLNPGGVRIGTAEIYRQVEAFDEITEALVIGQNITADGGHDVRVILFVRLTEGAVLDDALCRAIKKAIRSGATPRHVPAFILEVADIPRTRSGKITEMAVRDVVEGRDVKNTEALANPEALEYFRNRPELRP